MTTTEVIKVERNNKAYGWSLRHAPSGLYFFDGGLRLRRFAVEAREEFLATGVDWSKPKMSAQDAKRSTAVYRKWSARVKSRCLDQETGEFYGNHPGSGRLSTPDGSFTSWGAPNQQLAAAYAARLSIRADPQESRR